MWSAANPAAAAAADASTGHPPASLHADLIPRVCHYLQLRELVLFAATSWRHRRTICRPRPAAGAADCWLYVSTVRLRWGKKRPHWDVPGDVAGLELNGRRLESVNAALLRDMSSAAFTADLDACHAFAMALAPTSEQLQQTEAAAEQPVGAAGSLFNTLLSSSPSPLSLLGSPSPLLPSLAAFLRSIRHAQRVEYEQPAHSLPVLLTVLTALPSFPCLRHLGLQLPFPHQGQQMSSEERELEFTTRSVTVNAVNAALGCLSRLSSLSSLELHSYVPTLRRHPVHPKGADAQLAFDVLTDIFTHRLLHAQLPSQLLTEWMRGLSQAALVARQQQTAALSQSQRPCATAAQPATATFVSVVRQPTFHAGSPYNFWDDDSLCPQFRRLQSLHVSGDSFAMRRILHAFPSLLLLRTPSGVQYREVGISPSASSTASLRFLSTTAHIRGLPEMPSIASYSFLHSLQLYVGLQITGTAGIAPLSALAALTQLRELTLEVSGGSQRHGVYELQADELFDLSWLDCLTELRYLHIKAFQHINVRTLQLLCLLPPDEQPPHAAPLPPPPLFVSRVEELGLDVFERKVDLSRAADLIFGAWSRLTRCGCQFISLRLAMMFEAEKQFISAECSEANAVLRQRVGAERWVTEAQLIETRYDQRWKTQMAARL